MIRSAVGRDRSSPGWVTLGTGERLELAEPAARLRAKIIDLMILVAVMVGCVIVVLLALVADRSGLGIGIVDGVILASMLFGLVSLLYDPVFIAIRGQTIGKKLMRIRVVCADTGGLPSWGRSFGRWAVPGVLALVPYGGLILPLLCFASLTWEPSRRGWHDRVAGTVVVKT